MREAPIVIPKLGCVVVDALDTTRRSETAAFKAVMAPVGVTPTRRGHDNHDVRDPVSIMDTAQDAACLPVDLGPVSARDPIASCDVFERIFAEANGAEMAAKVTVTRKADTNPERLMPDSFGVQINGTYLRHAVRGVDDIRTAALLLGDWVRETLADRRSTLCNRIMAMDEPALAAMERCVEMIEGMH